MRLLRWMLLGMVLLLISPHLYAQTGHGMKAMQNAAQENKHLFIFFYKDQNERMQRVQKIFDQTMQKLGEQARFIKIQVNDPAEKQLVEQFELKRTPMPFTLVLAPNGAVVGGFPAATLTEVQLMAAFTSPGMANCLKALQAKKLVFLCLQNNHTTQNEAALQGVKSFKADPRFSSATEIVMMDPSDAQEQKFLDQLAVNRQSSQAITVFIAPPADTIAQYQGATNKERFVSDLQKAMSSCCPGGCCPGGCCPGGCCGGNKCK